MNNGDKNRSDDVGLIAHQEFKFNKEFTFENGHAVPDYSLRFETYGELDKDKKNAIMICHALSGDHHCAGRYSADDKKPGWWNNVIGPGKPIDTNHFYVICANCIGGCQGSTGPSSINPKTNKSYQLDFPELTVRDMVRTQKDLCDHLGLNGLFAVIGGSMGGMLTLQWAIEYPEYVNRIIGLATSARLSAQAIAFNEVGRCAIIQDPNWDNGNYTQDKTPDVGLAIARMMAHITYLSDEGMQRKFGRDKKESDSEHALFDVEFEVESYLRYQGESFVNRFDANTYLYLTKALDRFDLYGKENNLENSFKDIKARALIIGFTSDWLFPPKQNRDIVHAMLRSGKQATYAEVKMDLGHDSFLIDSPELYNLIHEFLTS